MSKLLLYYAHPGHKHSEVNKEMALAAQEIEGVKFQDLYAKYPRYDIDVELEQQLLLAHDVILFQFPLFWYSSPSLIKEWLDLVLEHGFAYGQDGDNLKGKTLMLAISAAGPRDAYAEAGYQNYPLRTFLTPLEQTAKLCKMNFLPPYVLFSSLNAKENGKLQDHVHTYKRLLLGLVNNTFDYSAASKHDFLTSSDLPVKHGAIQ